MVRITRSVVLLALLCTLVVAPSVAGCVEGANTSCCCSNSNSGGCHKPLRQDEPRAKCCDAPAAPTTATGAPTTIDPLPRIDTAEGPAVVCVTDIAGFRSVSDTRRFDPPPLRLFTLHSAFLI